MGARMSKNYTYNIDETSQDTRNFEIDSNKKLPQDIVESVYREISFKVNEVRDITKDTLHFLEEEGFDVNHQDFKGLKVTGTFTGTYYGDDSQIESGGEFFVLEQE
jgi:hypothetical protein